MSRTSTSIVILGGTGDLAQRMLVPALFDLHRKGRLPADMKVIGFSRASHDDDAYRELMSDGAAEKASISISAGEWKPFAEMLHYVSGDLTKPDGFEDLRARLEEIEKGAETCNRLYYLSINPALYTDAIESLQSSGLAREDNGWRRLLVEKPFGQDESSAHALDETIRDAFREDQVFRIDHFLGKETVQNLLAFRFANTIFEPLWSRNYIDHVQITVAESVDVGTRGAFYEQSGVVRDMVQNHLVQLLCMVAMEPPSLANPNADAVRGKKVEVLEAVRRWTPKEFQANSVAGQYQGYRDTANVAEDSNVATYAALRLYIDNWRWQGVPFYLRTGKAMGTRVSEIVVQFKQPPLAIFPASDGGSPSPNALSICVSPDEGIHLRMEAKIPGEGTKTQSVDMEFHYADAFAGNDIPEPYERLLEDALAGDCGLFIRSDQIRQAWNILDPLIKCWEGSEPHTYRRGTWGPAKADELLAESGHQWLTLCHHD